LSSSAASRRCRSSTAGGPARSVRLQPDNEVAVCVCPVRLLQIPDRPSQTELTE
jgi:hypothetical protein